MECFALIGMNYNKERYIYAHPVLRNLPPNWSESLVLKARRPRITGRILNRETNDEINEEINNELGYIIDVPGFFMEWDRLTEEKRLKYIQRLLKVLRENGIRIMVVPLLYEIFTKQEYNYCLDEGFILLDSFMIRLASQIEVVERLLTILEKKLHTMEVVIWRADTDIGRIWAEFLAPYFNYMVLGGNERKILDELSDEIINKTGLACRIIEKAEDIPRKHSMLIWTENFDVLANNMSSELLIFSGSINNDYLNQNKVGNTAILLEAGFIRFPDDLYCDVSLYPLEEMGVLEGLFYIISELYRITIHDDKINLNKVMDIRKLFKLYPLFSQGFISTNKTVSYNKFRRMYFRKN